MNVNKINLMKILKILLIVINVVYVWKKLIIIVLFLENV